MSLPSAYATPLELMTMALTESMVVRLVMVSADLRYWTPRSFGRTFYIDQRRWISPAEPLRLEWDGEELTNTNFVKWKLPIGNWRRGGYLQICDPHITPLWKIATNLDAMTVTEDAPITIEARAGDLIIKAAGDP